MKNKVDAQTRVLVALHGTDGKWITIDALRQREDHFTVPTLEAMRRAQYFPPIEFRYDDMGLITHVRLTKWGIPYAANMAARTRT